jgi:RimJ/RimL family protein N-acetyltransferase
MGHIIVGTIKRVADRRRIGFVALRAPSGEQDFWDFSYAIPGVRDRNAFNAINAIDAITHYMLDHVGVPALGGLTLEGNLPAQMVIRRMGYQVVGSREYSGRRWTVFRFGKEEWTQRLARLERAEALRPSGLGGVLAVLREAPFNPVVPTARIRDNLD